jgi:hypothetical protein
MSLVRTFSPVEWRRLLVLVAVVQLASALLFAFVVHKQIFDEVNYQSDTGRYEREGVTADSLRAHTSPAGPGMPILASLGGRLVPGSLAARRVPIFLAWVLAAGLLVGLSRQRHEDAVVPIAGLCLLAYPHSPLSMATLLSEGPSVACALAALLASGLAVVDGKQQVVPWYRVLVSGLFLGSALWFRQYYLALVPAFVVAWWPSPARLRNWALFAIGPVIAVAAYLALWKGLTSPAARAGLTYGTNVRAAMALNLLRPLSALAYVGAYALPLLPWGDRQRLARPVLLKLAAAGLCVALALVLSGRSPWGNGPIMSLIGVAGRVHPFAQRLADVVVAAAAFTSVLALVWLIRTSRDGWRAPFVLVCIAAVVFFALEQLGIDGSIPFYERYAHQVIFFSSALVLSFTQPRTGRVLAFVGVLVVISQLTLWGKAF